MPKQICTDVRPRVPTDGRPPLAPGASSRPDNIFQHAVRRTNEALFEGLPNDLFLSAVQPGSCALGLVRCPQSVLSPNAFFGRFQPSPEELQLAEALYQNLQAARHPMTVQHNLQAFLNEAIEMNGRMLVQYCFALGANANQNDRIGRLPLQTAVSTGNMAMVRELLARGADPNRRNAFGENAVQFAHREARRLAGERP